MIIYESQQYCPYCGSAVDDHLSEWESGETEVNCDRCERTYSVTTHYKFLGFEVNKICSECGSKETECFCDESEVETA